MHSHATPPQATPLFNDSMGVVSRAAKDEASSEKGLAARDCGASPGGCSVGGVGSLDQGESISAVGASPSQAWEFWGKGL